MGGFANVRMIEDLVIGVGLNNTKKIDQKYKNGCYGEFGHLQGFAAIQYLVKKQLYIKSEPRPTRSRIST